jgi:hypothetical protein
VRTRSKLPLEHGYLVLGGLQLCLEVLHLHTTHTRHTRTHNHHHQPPFIPFIAFRGGSRRPSPPSKEPGCPASRRSRRHQVRGWMGGQAGFTSLCFSCSRICSCSICSRSTCTPANDPHKRSDGGKREEKEKEREREKRNVQCQRLCGRDEWAPGGKNRGERARRGGG